MIKADYSVGRLRVTLEANSVNELFDLIKEITDKYNSEKISDLTLPINGTDEKPVKNRLIGSPISQVAQIREPDESISTMNKLIKINENGDIIPLFPKGTFRAKELILLYLYAKYVQDQKSQLKEVSSFLASEGITQGAKDVQMSALRKSRVIIQKENEIEIMNLPFVRKIVQKMTNKSGVN